jgi:hypothetical protein
VDDEQPSPQYERVHSGEMSVALDVLSAVAESSTLDAASRSAASRLHAQLTALRALERSWHVRQAGGLGDTDELHAALLLLPAGELGVTLLKLELGLAHGYPATLDPAQGDRRQALEYLTEAVQQLGPANPDPWAPLVTAVSFAAPSHSDGCGSHPHTTGWLPQPSEQKARKLQLTLLNSYGQRSTRQSGPGAG